MYSWWDSMLFLFILDVKRLAYSISRSPISNGRSYTKFVQSATGTIKHIQVLDDEKKYISNAQVFKNLILYNLVVATLSDPHNNVDRYITFETDETGSLYIPEKRVLDGMDFSFDDESLYTLPL